MKAICGILCLGILVQLATCEQKKPIADYIIYNADIWTADENNISAHAIAIAADTIMAIGDTETVQSFKGAQTQMLDMDGKFITPGFIDSHVHLMTGGRSLLSVDLRDAGSPEEFTQTNGF